MKKLAKSLVMTLVAAAATSVIAAVEQNPGNQYLGFSTAANPVYGDGSPVLSSERFALCWSLTGEFSGLKADGTAVETDTEKEKVINVYSLTKKSNGKFRATFFINAEDAETKGYYHVLILDTRETAGTLSEPMKINGVASSDFKVNTADPSLKQDGVIVSTDYNAGAYIDTPASLEIAVNDDGTATLKAVNLSPAVTYSIKYGLDLVDMNTIPVVWKNSEDLTKFGTAEVTISGKDGKFFKLEQK